jgi:hypothetical protein
VGGWLGCGRGWCWIPGRPLCIESARLSSLRLSESPVLGLTPPNASEVEKYAVAPCRDDDKVGSVGINFGYPGDKQVVRDYYRTELPSHGWTFNDAGSSASRLCFENSAKPGVSSGSGCPRTVQSRCRPRRTSWNFSSPLKACPVGADSCRPGRGGGLRLSSPASPPPFVPEGPGPSPEGR